jgi:spermidine synthase
MFDGHSMAGTSPQGQVYMRSMAHLPLLLHPDPRSALLICFGVGATADAIRTHRTIERLDVVDLNPSVFLLDRPFASVNRDVLADRRLRIVCDDGRQFLKLTDALYDFVTMEPPPPLQPGISRLYSAEFYEAVKKRLKPGGVVSQWLPESQMSEQGVDLIASTFVRAFPHTLLFVGFGRDLILVGSDRPFGYGRLTARMEGEPDVKQVLAGFGLGTAPRLLATILRTDESMRRQWAAGPVISDGFASLDALQINSPVQHAHPKSTWELTKRSLLYDAKDVLATLRTAAPEEAPEVERLLSDPRTMAVTVPPWYFPVSVR